MNEPRRIWLCADDYGLAPGVNAAIRELIVSGRLNATSVMVAAPHCGLEEVAALNTLNAGKTRAALGLHVTLTAPFAPLSAGFEPLRERAFLPVNDMLKRAGARRLKVEPLTIEIATQLRAFIDLFGRLPDFIDGHQHVHLFPQVRNAFLKVVSDAAPDVWVRQCGRARPHRRMHDHKSLVLDMLSLAFRRRPGGAASPPTRPLPAPTPSRPRPITPSSFRVSSRTAGRRADHVPSRLRRCGA